ncbi:MAG: fumarylacetoacetate hydrolase family protein [Bacteroidales bacterium]|jgi:2-keto-4-pentenoate hydratase/2-oxohepta-3-ene-1,7-dioic acid hydratase in catechol pathway|nr:2-hydroxyhepta-2,4-diene-1,7-dioate isomerase [Bacteroidota bacterium]MBQ9508279.1 fumarylacetoacetate hydrolase family protein [Bacteroidales bacterium]MBR6062840.1 fumarylacetoacetate hydrolase family protein [Bacteroidales bacterium]
MKIICIGKNYLKHIQELDRQRPSEPVFFMKPDSSIIIRNRPFFLPDFSEEIHHEVELIFRICKVGKCIQPKFAHTYYDAIGLGIDFTARDLQRKCVAEGNPWEIAKAFDGSAVISKFVEKEHFGDLNNMDFRLLLNDHCVQHGNSKDMLFSIDEIICHVSKFMTLKIGDIIFTGTPEGVGKVAINDRLQGFIGEEKFLDFKIK